MKILVDIDFQVVWNIKSASDFLFSLKEPELSIRAISEAAMREVIAQSELAPILNRDRAAIEANVRQLIQITLDERKTGISVIRVNFNKVDPPSRQVIVTAADGAQRSVSPLLTLSGTCKPLSKSVTNVNVRRMPTPTNAWLKPVVLGRRSWRLLKATVQQ